MPADGEDIYRYFVIPTGFVEDKVVVALEFSPGDSKVVHHANYLMDYGGRARTENAKDEEPAVWPVGKWPGRRSRAVRLSSVWRVASKRVTQRA